ncbi:PAS domain-containing protein [Streptomyces monticola]|uniref:PAS domain-containing protein n=1 Tax=Streptomyces monticola TaxID=2666263 RepID=A0ABW2JCJ4_9ACTN
MTQTEEFGEEFADFVRRINELKAARTVPADELHPVLEAALFELDHVTQKLWPRYEQLAASGAQGGSASGADRQEQQLLRAIFQRLPLPVALVDRETVVRRMNFAATSFTGVRAGYATGRPLAGLLAHSDRAAFRSQAAAVARGEGDRSLTVHLQQRPDDAVRATLTPVRPSNEPRTAVLVLLQPAEAGLQHPQSRPTVPMPDLAEATRHAALLDLVDSMASALLSGGTGDRAAVLERAARVLHGRFADWVITDSCGSSLVRTTVLGPQDEGEDEDRTARGARAARAATAEDKGAKDAKGAECAKGSTGGESATGGAGDPTAGRDKTAAAVRAVAEQDPAACPLVVEAARGGATALQVRPEDPDGFGRDATGAPVLVRANATSLLCVPLTGPDDGRVEGVLTLFRTGARLAFSMAEAQAVDVMSRHIALALRRAAG